MKNSNIERIGVYKVGLFFLEELKWIEREQPISDHGIDMQLEIVEEDKVTGILIGLQIKSGESYLKERKDNNIIYRSNNLRHLEYWENHSLPILIIIHNPKNNKLYWQSIASKNANIVTSPKSWKMTIPLEQKLTSSSKEDILNECFNFDNYQIIEENNISNSLQIKYTAKIIITAKEKYIIKRIIKNVYTKLINEYGDINTLTVWFYKNSYEILNGLPVITAQWNNPKNEKTSNTITIKSNDKINNINLEWNSTYQIFNKFHISNDNFISKFKYIKICDEKVNYCISVLETLKTKNLEEFKEYILLEKNNIRNNFNYISDEGYQLSTELNNLKHYRNNIISDIDNILMIVENQVISNIKIDTQIKSIRENIELYKCLILMIE